MSTPTCPISIASLPNEALEQIFKHLSRSDLKNISYTSKVLKSTAQRILFNAVYLRRHLTSFANLICIADNPTLSNYVNCVEYVDPDDFQEVKKTASQDGELAPVISCTDWLNKHPTRNFDTIFAQILDDIQSYDSDRADTFWEMNGTYCYGYEYLENADNAENLLRAPMSKLTELSTMICNSLDADGLDRYAWALIASLLEHESLLRFKSLVLLEQEPATWSARFSTLQAVFTKVKHLRKLHLGFKSVLDTPEQFSDVQKALSLSELTRLRLLTIAFEANTFDIQLRLSSFLDPGQHCVNLKQLSLKGIVVDYHHFVSMLKANASSLKSLQLINIRLTSALPRIGYVLVWEDGDVLTRPRDSLVLSWKDLIVFLNQDMSLSEFTCAGWLETVSGSLKHSQTELEAGYGEFWRVACPNVHEEFIEEPFFWHRRGSEELLEEHNDCLNRRINQYVLHQGPPPPQSSQRILSAEEVEAGEALGAQRLAWYWGEDECFRWHRDSYEDALQPSDV